MQKTVEGVYLATEKIEDRVAIGEKTGQNHVEIEKCTRQNSVLKKGVG